MKIIGGKHKGKKLNLPNKEITRPLRDMVKESIFNLILHSKKINLDIDNSKVLDLFAGSGSFGIECLSRGAQKIFFCEKNYETIEILKKNISSLNKSYDYEIINSDCFEILKTGINFFSNKFDIIFVDPPYKESKLNEILINIFNLKILKEEGIIILHRHYKEKVDIFNKFEIIENRKYGLSKIIICKI